MAPVSWPAPVMRRFVNRKVALHVQDSTDRRNRGVVFCGPCERSGEEMGRAWSSILGIPTDASGAQIEAAYHAKLAECDRVRFDTDASAASRRQAEQQRARVNQAYEFIRPAR
jgi:hypothetical protein